MKRKEFIETGFALVFIGFWLYVLHAKAGDFPQFKKELLGQVFPKRVSGLLAYQLPLLWLSICFMLAFARTRLLGLLLNLLTLLGLSMYVGLALAEVYPFMPCSCSGLFHLSWEGHFYFNLIVTAVAAAGFIFTFKDKERRKSVWVR